MPPQALISRPGRHFERELSRVRRVSSQEDVECRCSSPTKLNWEHPGGKGQPSRLSSRQEAHAEGVKCSRPGRQVERECSRPERRVQRPLPRLAKGLSQRFLCEGASTESLDSNQLSSRKASVGGVKIEQVSRWREKHPHMPSTEDLPPAVSPTPLPAPGHFVAEEEHRQRNHIKI